MVCMVFIIALPTLEYCFFRTPDICWSYQVVSPDQCKKKTPPGWTSQSFVA
jgi:hypothetical protein